MGVKILTIEEAKKMAELAEKYSEYFAGLIGLAVKPYLCDNSGANIERGETCCACVILPYKGHPAELYQVKSLKNYLGAHYWKLLITPNDFKQDFTAKY